MTVRFSSKISSSRWLSPSALSLMYPADGIPGYSRGQFIDASLFEAALSLSIWETTEYWATGRSPQPLGSANRMSAPYQAFGASDGTFVVGAANPLDLGAVTGNGNDLTLTGLVTSSGFTGVDDRGCESSGVAHGV